MLIAAKIDQYNGEFSGDRFREEFASSVEDIRRRYPNPFKKSQRFKKAHCGRDNKGKC